MRIIRSVYFIVFQKSCTVIAAFFVMVQVARAAGVARMKSASNAAPRDIVFRSAGKTT